jgi:four helix bundle protein
MDKSDLQRRTKQFALRTLKLTAAMPRTFASDAVARQLVRSGMSVGANYRAACKARSRAEFVAKVGLVEEEADESAYWMELLMEGGIMKPQLVQPLLDEARQIALIMGASRRTAQRQAAKVRP